MSRCTLGVLSVGLKQTWCIDEDDLSIVLGDNTEYLPHGGVTELGDGGNVLLHQGVQQCRLSWEGRVD